MDQKCRKMSTEIELVRAEKESIVAQKVTLENKVRQLERDINEKMDKFEGVIREVSHSGWVTKRLFMKMILIIQLAWSSTIDIQLWWNHLKSSCTKD